jgi:DUF1365 family protein
VTPLASAVYEGKLTHTRRGPRRHQFAMRLHMFYLDLDEMERALPISLLRRGRFGWLSFCRADYLGNPAQSLKSEVLDLVESRIGRRPSGPVRLLTQVRWFGYVFNPVSFYYCFARDGVTLDAVVSEITNTPWQERHAYVLPAERAGVSPERSRSVRASFPKAFHVSPFFDMAQRYRWLLTTPADDLVVTRVNQEEGRDVFSATLALERRPLSPAILWSLVLRQPLMSWRVHLGIYIHAFRLWLKGTPYFEHPSPACAERSRSADLPRSETWKV